ncbi:MAG: CorA family divalent cation transporter [Bacteroidales bacterium]|nr:CorA family divalent cation transporter [Bacteroidales bacterium]
MIEIFYRSEGRISVSQSESVFAELQKSDVVWIDLLSPTGEEKRATESFLGTTIQSRAQAEEIESSSRFFENERAVFANTSFVIPGPEEYSMETVSFVLCDSVLATIREVSLRSFLDIQRRLQVFPKRYPNGYHVFIAILEQRVDLDADMIELMSKEISQFGKKINLGEDVNEEFLLDINQLQENTMLVRENIVDKQRMITSILKSNKYPREYQTRLNVLLKDISSLINHTNFSFERLEYLQNTVLGLINLDQNRIMKIFTLVSLLLMPPTLVTGFFGMNVFGDRLEINPAIVWPLVALCIIIPVIVIVFVFKKKKMF